MINKKEILKCILSFFYVGYLPGGGTFVSIFPVLVYYFLRSDFFIFNVFALVFLFISFIAAKSAQEVFKHHDPSAMVLDEVSGVLISFIFLPFSWPLAITGFIIFRLFDILKIYPLRKLEDVPGSAGIVLDDLAAGVYTNIILQIILRGGWV